MLYADESDLGFDPTMAVHKTLEDGTQQYDIGVRLADGTCQTYRTKGLLANNGGAYLQGRGTRVWEAVQLENGHETDGVVALKDSWVDDYREREGSINACILRAPASQEERAQLDETIIQVRAYGDVYVAGLPDRTRVMPSVPSGELDAHFGATRIDRSSRTHI